MLRGSCHHQTLAAVDVLQGARGPSNRFQAPSTSPMACGHGCFQSQVENPSELPWSSLSSTQSSCLPTTCQPGRHKQAFGLRLLRPWPVESPPSSEHKFQGLRPRRLPKPSRKPFRASTVWFGQHAELLSSDHPATRHTQAFGLRLLASLLCCLPIHHRTTTSHDTGTNAAPVPAQSPIRL